MTPAQRCLGRESIIKAKSWILQSVNSQKIDSPGQSRPMLAVNGPIVVVQWSSFTMLLLWLFVTVLLYYAWLGKKERQLLEKKRGEEEIFIKWLQERQFI
ncbi:hypothetical protein Tdes44962_MAKER08249 [Teratosphaeria destructans]|uniref:Uncharacterized protein n=1 Tax=Teratosphaeria destructans TaxID=418781 RepID=A0A9W7W580_9PEZI|nr:hypothetical protein Tdes44962_MAKER08249 [Teratosphaeria destructans]